MINWSNVYVKFIIVGIVALITGVVLAYFLLPTKTITVTKTVEKLVTVNKKEHKTQKPDGTIVTDTTTDYNSKTNTDEYSKTEINARKYDLMVTLRRDIDSGTTAVGAQFVFEPFSHAILGAGYERGLKTKSNSILIIAGIRL